jgi:UDP-N-acetylmuramoylalanine--D-glutamate ligase
MIMTNWNNTHTLILGAARQGISLARWLSCHGSRVTLSDSRSMEQLASARASLADTNVEWAAGGHPLELLTGVDILCLSGGVPLTLPIVKEAAKRGIPLSNDTQIFLEVSPCKTIGITGSAGKTTTTTLVGEMAKRHYATRNTQHAFIGGNIGNPLINYVDEMTADDLAIIEISSFQLEQMTISPNISAILNITPNHLDRHGTMEAYISAKARILRFQTDRDTAILSHDDKGAWNLRNQVKGKLLTFSLTALTDDLDGAYFHDGLLSLREGKAYVPLMPREKIQLRGDHNVANVLAAFTIGQAAGFKLDDMLEAVEEFRGVPHRLELVRELRGVRWYNGSIATAPERSMADINAFNEPIVLMLGGRDKDLPWDGIAKLIHKRVDHVVLFGEAAELIQNAISAAGGARSGDLRRANDFKEAVTIAAEVASAGDIVLFSPGGTSYDEFKDFEERGETFKKWVLDLS